MFSAVTRLNNLALLSLCRVPWQSKVLVLYNTKVEPLVPRNLAIALGSLFLILLISPKHAFVPIFRLLAKLLVVGCVPLLLVDACVVLLLAVACVALPLVVACAFKKSKLTKCSVFVVLTHLEMTSC